MQLVVHHLLGMVAPRTATKMLRLDIDNIHPRPRLELQRIFYAMPRPFFVRLSSSGKGLHMVIPACQEWDYRRICYDDPIRIDLDTRRVRQAVPVHNLLWDMKNGKRAGAWQIMRTEKDIEAYFDVIKQRI